MICSSFARARAIFWTMSSTVAVQMKGFGSSFQALRNSSIACFKSGTLTKLPRRIALSVNSRNQRSTKFNQLELVGTQWQTKRGCLFSQRCTNSITALATLEKGTGTTNNYLYLGDSAGNIYDATVTSTTPPNPASCVTGSGSKILALAANSTALLYATSGGDNV